MLFHLLNNFQDVVCSPVNASLKMTPARVLIYIESLNKNLETNCSQGIKTLCRIIIQRCCTAVHQRCTIVQWYCTTVQVAITFVQHKKTFVQACRTIVQRHCTTEQERCTIIRNLEFINNQSLKGWYDYRKSDTKRA